MTDRLKIGDRVIVVTHKWDTRIESQLGCTGVIVKTRPDSNSFTYEVRLDQMRKNTFLLNYDEGDLELDCTKAAMEPDISLDEIHAFQDLVNGA